MFRTHGVASAIVATTALIVTIVFAARFFALRAPYAEAITIGNNAPTFEVLSKRFEDLAREKGGIYAFEVLRRAQLPTNTDLHLLGHAVGDVFYTQSGVDGIAHCTQDFRNACSHTMVIGALNEFGSGDETLTLIDEACKKAPGGTGAYTMCYHGLGHGVFAYFDYDLQKTVSYCKKMGTAQYHDEQFTQCVSGAIMELLSGGGHDKDAWIAAREKYLSVSDPLTPCDSAIIPTKAKGYCYLYLTSQLFKAAGMDIGHPDPAAFPKAFSYCDRISAAAGGDSREACFAGFGKEFIGFVAGRDIRAIDRLPDGAYAQAQAWCELAGKDADVEACLRQALESVFWGGENDPAASFRFCSVIEDSRKDVCLRFLAGNIEHYLRGEERVRWCEQLPESYRSTCAQVS